MNSEFELLMGELNVLAKSHSVEGAADADATEATAAAAATADAATTAATEATAATGEEATVAKSFTVKLADGSEVEATDGADLIKALTDRIDASEKNFVSALTTAVKIIKSTDVLVKSLQEQITKLGSEGKGRKATVTVFSKSQTQVTAAEKTEDGMPIQEFMAKAMEACTAGKLTGHEVSLAEACVNRNSPVPENIVRKVLAATK